MRSHANATEHERSVRLDGRDRESSTAADGALVAHSQSLKRRQDRHGAWPIEISK
jgi:hypothetical protein